MKFVRALQMLSLAAAANAFTVEEVKVPSTEDEKHDNIGTTKITMGDGTEYDTEYHVIYRSGDDVDGVVFGAVLDQNGDPIMAYPMDSSYVEEPMDNVPGDEPLISHVVDFTSLLSANNTTAPTDYAMFAHFETPLPANIYRINVDFDTDCTVITDSIEPTNWSAWGGLWEPCSGKVTPWNTHLGSEEHEPDAKLMEGTYAEFVTAYKAGSSHALNVMHFMRYYGLYSANVTTEEEFEGLKEKFNPYKFGHVTELSVEEDGSTKTQKWYTTGRVSIENPEIMPDNATIYIADDANYGILTRFVMDTPGNMSVGTLYAANWTQAANEWLAVGKQGPATTTTDEETTTTAGGYFSIEWIELGHATQEEISDMIWGTDKMKPLVFSDIFDSEDSKGFDMCSPGFTYIQNGWATMQEECLTVKPGMEIAAAFLETRRYANMLGATAEMQSTEGMASVPKENKFYLSMSAIKNGMSDGLGSIDVPENKCGCVYEFDVDPATQALTTGRALICGEPDDKDPLNACSTDSIASPDNLAYTGLFGTDDDHSLLIAEDTSHHQNDYLWHFDIETAKMDRILTTGYGTQVTGPAYFSDGMGCYLLMAVVPHPYKKSDKDMVNATNTNNLGLGGNVGYIGPIGTREEL
jgi:secreted PhoX family phosphatase